MKTTLGQQFVIATAYNKSFGIFAFNNGWDDTRDLITVGRETCLYGFKTEADAQDFADRYLVLKEKSIIR